ncbi:cell division topological specificity factor MinE [Candidatus Poribacteria bacterium]|jgi:cell division topological specificity factor|nr:cell division topological specificity factor MinE [Candidatus Poribacteria bacterium]MAP93167.1 cell division topological specificity factor MinE [Candidatus Poribacteria bacterium]MBP98209.1 cell division topological specificity factor MinE [Candidatus Poribacteria bacterium]MCH2575710.1 cell division topological specificity factor MinE [Candidatus Poribacteria bacterium]OUT54962.1 MAG: cell division topological specificity factor MinE [bacterium TMED15]|tara:strand:+ start:731 stop:994 length:264 start_codon:yes stop_codon:yes gene_type:complete
MLQRLIRLLRGTETSSKTAKSRLKLILVQDRLGIDEEVMKELQVEITQVLSRHFTLGEQVEIDLQREEQAMALVANIPITGMKDRKK